MNYAVDSLETYQILTSSCVGAIITSILVTPLDVIKTRLQVPPKRGFLSINIGTQKKHLTFPNGGSLTCCNEIADHVSQCINGSCKKTNFGISLYKSPGHLISSFDVFHKIVKTEGVTSLWSGLSPTLIMAIPQVVIYYTLNDCLKSITGYTSFQKGFVANVCDDSNKFARYDMIPPICGGISRVVAQGVIAPLELIRTKMQSTKLTYTQIRNIMHVSLRQDGLSVLWRGIGPTMWRDIPYTVCLWFIYEYLKKRHLRSTRSLSDDASLPRHLTFVYSACGAIVAGVVSHPFDVTKTHKQIELGDTASYNRKVTSTWAYVKLLKNSQGYSALFAGFYPRIIKVVIATSTMITIFESMKNFFVYHNKHHRVRTDIIYQ